MQFGFSILKLPDMHLCLWLQPKDDPTHDEWLAAIRGMEALRASGIPPEQVRSLVITDGAAPNAVQRKLLAAIWDGKHVKCAVVTTDLETPAKRGIATAFTWVNPQCGYYRPEQVLDALAHVEASRYSERIWNEYETLQKGLPAITNLRLATRALKPASSAPKS